MTAVLRSPVFWLRVVSLVAIVSVALGAARLTWRLVGWDDGRRTVWTPTSLAPVGGAAGGDLASILGWAPFGGGATGLDGLPISNLGLALKGVIYASGGGSSALISSGGGPVQVFTIGQTPIGDAVIEAIDMDRVILNVGGRREILVMPNPAGTAAPGGAPALPAQTNPPSEPASAAAPSAPPPAAAVAPPTPAAMTPSAAVSTMGVAPGPEGYVVGADSAPHLLRAGLRPGDVIKSLNGQPLGDPESDRQTFRRAAAGGRARVEVVRDGRSLTLTVPLR